MAVCRAVSSAGRLWPARLRSERIVRRERRSGVGRGKWAGWRRVWPEGSPDEQPSVDGRGRPAHGWWRAGQLVESSSDGGRIVG